MPDSQIQNTLLAALGPDQANRLIRLHTHLGDDVLLGERMVCEETVGPCQGPDGRVINGYRLEILALSTNAHLKLKDLIGQPVRLDLLTQQSRQDLRPFHGHVTQVGLLGTNNGLCRYHIIVEPFLHFMGHRRDSWTFQDRTVMEIIDELLSDYQGQGRLTPAWRWELADPQAYPKRSLCIQYEESDLDFISRLMVEEGLFYYFEHGASDGDSLGQHTMVLTDHNGKFKPNAQPQVRFTQSGAASFKEDSLTRFHAHHGVTTTALAMSSWDYRTVQQPSAEVQAPFLPAGLQLVRREQPGAYAFEDSAQAERITRCKLEAVQAVAAQCEAEGPWRQAMCGTTFNLIEHALVAADTTFVTVSVTHRARSNITPSQQSQLDDMLGEIAPAFKLTGLRKSKPKLKPASQRAVRPSLFADQDLRSSESALSNASEEPLYHARLLVQDLTTPLRAPGPLRNLHSGVAAAFQRPSIEGEVTALVVGLGGPIHTDRDNRIKIQFHWQRGDQSSHRLRHVAGSNAPASDASGTWARVVQAQAGKNWGGNFVPREGQEVKVAFVSGDPDRPVVTGSLYNGRGQPDAQGNQVNDGAANATGNAAAWFPGSKAAGEHEGHAHAAVLSGIKTQAMAKSQTGTGGYNQLVFDDSPKQSRITVGTTQAQTWLNLGHLIRQEDNQRLDKRGHGIELITSAQGALRAGSGMYLSTDAGRQGSTGGVQLSDAKAAVNRLQVALERTSALMDMAQKHEAKLQGEVEPGKLAVSAALAAVIEAQNATETRGTAGSVDASDAEIQSIGGGQGTIVAPSRPDLMLFGGKGMAIATPAHSVYTAGASASLIAGQDINLGSQRHTAIVAAKGISLFTQGKQAEGAKPTVQTGIQLHAAAGAVSVQAQDNSAKLTAAQAIKVSSNVGVAMGAPKHILLTAGGSAIRLTNGSITLTTRSMATFKAAMKELTGASSGSTSLSLQKAKELKGCATYTKYPAMGAEASVLLD